tara:strand:+ start:305 stop:499 length:195 start_codon:yes stop_codon:yes gene_type:complete
MIDKKKEIIIRKYKPAFPPTKTVPTVKIIELILKSVINVFELTKFKNNVPTPLPEKNKINAINW